MITEGGDANFHLLRQIQDGHSGFATGWKSIDRYRDCTQPFSSAPLKVSLSLKQGPRQHLGTYFHLRKDKSQCGFSDVFMGNFF